MKIRKAHRDDDFQAVAQLYLDVWRATYVQLLPAAFLAQLTTNTWHPERRWQETWVAFDDRGKLIGSCAAGPAREQGCEDWGEVYSIYIHPNQQHQGVGHQLMAAALTTLQGSFTQVYVEVLATNQSARDFYRQIGFTQKGTVQKRTVPQGELSVVRMVLNPA
ncbi:GNAT family N-acetyltransferase [Levilactobacillus fuyuanensis]|uniref:GNAT family N-acetyltransferase n=2 Tax=Levilactobacillus fuyuanensis TaxID=2486022 RepID=A0ABW4H6T5_9LACO|nr:GNAT family N-acetyltransferase [Levilactobacillus fuyuanensis]